MVIVTETGFDWTLSSGTPYDNASHCNSLREYGLMYLFLENKNCHHNHDYLLLEGLLLTQNCQSVRSGPCHAHSIQPTEKNMYQPCKT